MNTAFPFVGLHGSLGARNDLVERGLWTRFEPVQRPGSTLASQPLFNPAVS